MKPNPKGSEAGAENVRAVNRALELLLAFSQEDFELTVSELRERVPLSRPTLYRLLYTLEDKGFIVSSGDPQRFRLGPAVAKLTRVWTETLDIGAVAEPMMRRLWLETRETVALYIAQQDLRLCLAEMASPQPLNFKRGVGHTEHIALGASGWAILAFAPDASERAEAYAERLKLDLTRFQRELCSARERGFAVSRNELLEGAAAIAAPYYSGDKVLGSLVIYGPSSRLTEDVESTVGALIVQEAANLSAALGSMGAKGAVSPTRTRLHLAP